MDKTKLIREQLDRKIRKFEDLQDLMIPPSGWIYAIRQGINMSLRQLGQRLSITPQSVREIEEREKNGTISLKVLKQVAAAMDMQFVYGFIPKGNSLEKMVNARAEQLARIIVERTKMQMELENQQPSDERIQAAIQEKVDELKRDIPRSFWD
jgi:predicted DNA-binding mobile mystery protein A